jgi:hypothetical protein
MGVPSDDATGKLRAWWHDELEVVVAEGIDPHDNYLVEGCILNTKERKDEILSKHHYLR